MTHPPPALADFLATLQAQTANGAARLPPVDRWNPPDCGDAGIEIRTDGSWWHENTRMTREALVRLFASILRKDEDGVTYLVTPVEKVRVRVEDAPLLAVRADRHGEGQTQHIAFTTNMGDVFTAGPDHPIRLAYRGEEPRPYVLVRGRLEARILRAPFYELVGWATQRDQEMGVWSNGAYFPLGPVWGAE
jgi:hypothetical protein